MSKQLEALMAREKKLKEQIKQAKEKAKRKDARQNKAERLAVRKLDTRKKILAGATVFNLMKKDPALKEKVMGEIRRSLKSDKDRELFDLDPLPTLVEKSPPPVETKSPV